MREVELIKRLVAYYTRNFRTSNPFEIAEHLGVMYQIGNCEHDGCYMFLKNHRYIFLSNKLGENELMIVMAHELGHAVLDPKVNSYFIRNRTFLLSSRIEQRAHLFTAYLLITDGMLHDYVGCTREQFCNCTGYPEELIELRLK